MSTETEKKSRLKDAMDSITPSLGDKFIEKFLKQPKEITVRTWIIGKDKEICVDEKKVKLGTLDVPIGAHKYTIVYDAIQNIKGKLYYNTKHGVANGALRYRMNVDKEVDSRIRSSMASRENLTAIWGKWHMPLIIALIAILASILFAVLFAVTLGQATNAQSCLANEQCMLSKIAILKAQAQKEANANNG